MPELFPLSPKTRIKNLNERNNFPKGEDMILEAYFDKTLIEDLLTHPDAIGIRIYPYYRDRVSGTFSTMLSRSSMLAVAVMTVDENMDKDSAKNRGDIAGKYVISGGRDKNLEGQTIITTTTDEFLRIQDDVKLMQGYLTLEETEVEDINECIPGYFSVFFSRESIEYFTQIEGCKGLRFITHRLTDIFNTYIKPLTMSVVAVDDMDMTIIKEIDGFEVAALESLSPCPPDCGDPKRYINPYEVDLDENIFPIGDVEYG